MKKTLAIAFAASLLLAVDAAARVRTGTLAGTVIGANGKPVAQADIVIERSDGSHPIGAHTNSQGRFFVPFLEPGLYDVRATHGTKSSPWKHNLWVHRGKQTEVSLHLERTKPVKIPASMGKN
jgi:Carboxypeptidase regulatory-like domain